MRLAVELGAARTRLAVLDGAEARILPPAPPSVSVPAAVSGAAGRRPDELVVVHPPHWSPAAVRTAGARLADRAASVRVTSAAHAAATELAARTPLPPGPLAVVHVDPAAVTVTVLAGARSARVLACRRLPGASPPDALAAVTAAARLPPYALTAGVLLLAPDPARWRAPLAALVGEPPLAPSDADRLALLGALRPPRRARTRSLRRTALPADPAPPGDEWSGEALAAGLLAPPPVRRRIRPVLLALALPLLAAAAAGLVAALLAEASGRSGPVARADAADGVLAQYDYALRLPAGWRHSGGLPERRRTLLTPAGAPNGSDLISVEQHPLGYDGAAERDRAVRELGEQLRQARAAGADLTEPTGRVRLGDREFATYRERQPLLGAEVDWYVLFERDAQLSVGCRHGPAGVDAVRAACAEVTASVQHRTPAGP